MALEPTYEGLKQSDVLLAEAGFQGLEPTYEGLKPRFWLTTRGSGVRLEPTYEGLKPSCNEVPEGVPGLVEKRGSSAPGGEWNKG